MAVPKRSTAAGIALLVAATAAGCGGSSEGPNAKNFSGEKKNVAKTVDDLQSAARKGDTGKICRDLFTSGLALAVTKRNHTTCQAKVQQQLASKNESITITQLAVAVPQAVAQVQEQNGNISRLTFLKVNGKWRVNGIQ